mmetsp:Transcript_14632/g.27469  ORF Transcript_14632/g.27469 Transcript_14632/m.27469 type:complete len:172 (-) Transcript_14632:94-609(-)
MDAQAMLAALAALDDTSLITVITETLQRRPELAPGVVNGAVPDLTFAPADSLTKRRATGRIKPAMGTGLGFIDCPELKAVFGSDVYVHKNQVGALQPGTEVSFAILLSKDMKPQAFDLQPTAPRPPPPKGAGKAHGYPFGAMPPPPISQVNQGFWGGKGGHGFHGGMPGQF